MRLMRLPAAWLVLAMAAPVSAQAPEGPPMSPQPPPSPSAPSRPPYNGPRAGRATWTGKLGKNETLTITGGTASAGVLSDAGLPGVPGRIVVDQTNLGFVERPETSNGFSRLVLRSHAQPDNMTIHWTVIQ